MVLQRVYEDITKIKLVKTILGTTVIHTSPFVHIFHIATGEVELANELGDTFSFTPPETIKGLTLEMQLWQDPEQDSVAFRYLYKDTNGTSKADVRIAFYFSVDPGKVKIRIEGTLATPLTLKIPFRSLTHFVHGNCFWSGVYNEEMGVIERGVGFDWGDIKNAVGDACRWNSASKCLEVDVPATFALDPNTVVSANGAATYYTFQKKILRTSDGTIHMLIRRTGYITHYHSHDNGFSWDSADVWSVSQACTIDKDSDGNLVAARAENSNVFFKKATVTKNGTWSWSWGSEKTVDGAFTTFSYPDILVDGNGYYHVVYYRSDSYPRWARCTDGSGDSWTVTELSGFSSNLCAVSVAKDSSSNLFVFGARTDRNSLLKAVKITYNGGTSWTVGTYYSVSSANAYPACTHFLPNDKLVVTYCINASYDLRFQKSTNASDVSAWGSAVAIKDGIDARYSHGLMVVDNNKVRVYYCDGNALLYKESTDGGVSWSSEQTDYSTGVNAYPNLAKTVVNGRVDFVWMNGTADPYTIFHEFYEAAAVKEVVDALCCWEVALCSKAFGVSDGVGLADSPLKGWAPVVADLMSVSEVVEVVVGAVVKYVGDVVGLVEGIRLDRALFVLDCVGSADGACVGKVLAVSDGVFVVEVVERGVAGVVRTKLFLFLGDLAVQLCG
jgi:hypothetical protein